MTYLEVTDYDYNSISDSLIIEANGTSQAVASKVKFLDYIADTRPGLIIDTEEKRVAMPVELLDTDEDGQPVMVPNRGRVLTFDAFFKHLGGELQDLIQDFVDHSDDLDFEQVREEADPMEDAASEAYRDHIYAQRI